MSDFNARRQTEVMYVNDPEIRQTLDLFLQELDILFSTEKMTVYGNRDFGISFEELLWNTTFSSSYIQSIISKGIRDFCQLSQEFRWDVNVQMVQGVSRDIGVVDIHIKNNEDGQLASTRFVFK